MSAVERVERQDALYLLLTRLPGQDFGGVPECAETDPELFFPEPGQARQVLKARAICQRCPVMASCREFAIRNGELGVWGGTTVMERREIRRWRRLAEVRRSDDSVRVSAERALTAIEDVTGEPAPALRKRVRAILSRRGATEDKRTAEVLAVLRPELERLSVLDRRTSEMPGEAAA